MSTPNYNFPLTTGGAVKTLHALNDGLTMVDRQMFLLESLGLRGPRSTSIPMTYIKGGRLSRDRLGRNILSDLECYIPQGGDIFRLEEPVMLRYSSTSSQAHIFAGVDDDGKMIIKTYGNSQVSFTEYMPTVWINQSGERYIGTTMLTGNSTYPSELLEGETIFSGEGTSLGAMSIGTSTTGAPMTYAVSLTGKVPHRQVRSVTVSMLLNSGRSNPDDPMKLFFVGHNGHKVYAGDLSTKVRHIDKIPVTPGKPSLMLGIQGRSAHASVALSLLAFRYDR